MKIIDFEKKGQSIRFYLGDNDCNDYWGDDWKDAPYDCNAGRVYDEFIKDTVDITFKFDDIVLEPCDDYNYTNVPYSKEDMKKQKVPCIIVLTDENDTWEYEDNFSKALANKKCKKFYFNDPVEKLND